MGTITINTKPNQKGTKISVVAYIRHKGDRKMITITSVENRHWDANKFRVKDSHLLHAQLNKKIINTIRPIEDRIADLEVIGKDYEIIDIFDYNETGMLVEAIERYIYDRSSQILSLIHI